MQPRILLIEDIKSTRTAYRRVLELEGMQVHEAASLAEAKQALRRVAFHVVCIDLSLDESDPSNMDGTKVLQEVNSYQEGTRMIIVSNRSGERAHDIAIDAYENFKLAKWLRKGDFSVDKFVAVVVSEAQKVELPFFRSTTSMLEALVYGQDTDIWIDNVLRALTPRGGVATLRNLLDTLSHDLTPIRPHKELRQRARIDSAKKCVEFEFWSRGIGSAVAIKVAARDGACDINESAVIKKVSLGGLSGYALRLDEGVPENF